MELFTKITMNTLFNPMTQNIKMETHDEIISRLKFIGNIQEGEKINVKNMYIQPNGMITALSRTVYNQDNRSNTLTFVTNTIKRCFDLLNLYVNSKQHTEILMCYNLFNDLKKSEFGLKNLKKTYNTDIMFCCKIDTLLQEISVVLDEIKTSLVKLHHNSEKERIND